MARRKIGKLREVKVDIANYSYLMNGIAGIGKTTTVSEIGVSKYGVDGYLLLTIGQEPEPEHIGNIINERAVDWEDLEEIIETICEYKKEDYPNLRMIGIDSVDEVFRLAENRAIEIYNSKVDVSKRVDSISAAWGGFQKGENKVVDMVSNLLFSLRDHGISLFFIGHTKAKNKVDQMTDVEYELITSNLDSKYYNCIKDKVNVVMCAYIEREMTDLETMKDAFTKKNKQVGKIASEKRVVSFRDEEFAVDVKSHLTHIVPKCELNAQVIINELETAIKKQAEMFHGAKTDDEIKTKAKEQAKKQAETPVKKIDETPIKEEKLSKIKSNFSKLDMSKLKPIMDEYSITTFNDVTAIPMVALDKILELI